MARKGVGVRHSCTVVAETRREEKLGCEEKGE